jgi:hypothetical protein
MYLLLLLLSPMFVRADQTVLGCSVTNTTLHPPSTAFVVSKSCVAVHYTNVVVEGANTTLTFDVSSFVEANNAAAVINITVLNLTLLDGAAAIVSSADYTSGTGGGSEGRTVSVAFRGLTGRDGGLGITGAFPPGTLILIHGANMTEGGSRTPTFVPSLTNITRYSQRKLMIFSNVHLREASSIVVAASSLGDRARLPQIDLIALYITGDLMLEEKSTLSFVDVTFNNRNDAVKLIQANVSVTDRCSWSFTRVSIYSDRNGIVVDDSIVLIALNSLWALYSAKIECRGGAALYFTGSTISLSGTSLFSILTTKLSSPLGLSIINSSVLADSSELRIDKSQLATFAFGLSNMTLRGGSSLALMHLIFSSNAYLIGALSFSGWDGLRTFRHSSLVVEGGSDWIVKGCIATVTAASAIFFLFFHVVIANGSSWRVEDSVDSTLGTSAAALALEFSTLVVRASSEVRMEQNAFAAVSAAAVLVTQSSRVVISELSAWVIEGGSYSGMSNAVKFDRKSEIVVERASSMVLSGVTLIAKAEADAAVKLSNGVTVESGSLLLVHTNNLQQQTRWAQMTCIDLGTMRLGDYGAIRFTNNDCTTPTDSAASSVDIALMRGREQISEATGFPQLVARCNRVNGAVWSPDADALELMPNFVLVRCGLCNALVDCFLPLTDVPAFTRLACADDGASSAASTSGFVGAAQCPCVAQCGGAGCSSLRGRMCLPGTATAFGANRASEAFHGVRLRLTLTASITQSAPGSVTYSATLHDKDPNTDGTISSAQHRSAVVGSTAMALKGGAAASMMQRMLAQQRINNCGARKVWGWRTRLLQQPDTDDPWW